MASFELLAEPIQRALWKMGWTALRPIQERAIPIVLQSQRDLVISARTAAGKTEAAFLPVLSSVIEAPRSSVRAIYVGPLKALINDQFRRLEELAELADIPVHRWHGDVSSSRKSAVVKGPSGVLLITPESLEALFVNRGNQLSRMFENLSFVVLDELHALLGTERGLHLRSLLFRLQRLVLPAPRLIALSATLGDLQVTASWLRPDAPDSVEILTDEGQRKSIKFRIHGYLKAPSEKHSPNAKATPATLDMSSPSPVWKESPQAETALTLSESLDQSAPQAELMKSADLVPQMLANGSEVPAQTTEVGPRPRVNTSNPQPAHDEGTLVRGNTPDADGLSSSGLPIQVPAHAIDPGELEEVPHSQSIPPEMLLDMFEFFQGQKNLIFANSKSIVEECADGLNTLCQSRGVREQFLVHHGSLSREIREETEQRMQGETPYTTVCSSTLEMGIDIGNVAAIGQIGAPHAVSSMAQRLGRSGRKDHEAHCMRVFIPESTPNVQSRLADRLFLELVQSVALTELMLQRWFEPPESDAGDLSTLVHQVLSILAETGGLRADHLYDRLVTNGAFRSLKQPTFGAVLRSLASHDLIEQMSEGDLILGLAGQKIVSHYDFYCAFEAGCEYRVVHESHLIGSLPAAAIPPLLEHVLLAGRRWQIERVDDQRREISVRPARGRKSPFFPPSERAVHPRVRQQMQVVLAGDQSVPYLSQSGNEMLQSARQVAQQSGVLRGHILVGSSVQSIWFPWCGSKGMRTLEALCKLANLTVKTVGRMPVSLEFEHSSEHVLSVLEHLVVNVPTDVRIAEQITPKNLRKYDDFLTPDLLNLAISYGSLDVSDAMRAIQRALRPVDD